MKHTQLHVYALAASLIASALGSVGDALTVQAILNTMTPDDFFDLANRPAPESEYALAAVLPQELRATYEAKAGSLKVIATPAGETGMDSPYVPVGLIEINALSKPIAKWTAESLMTEQQQRELQQMLLHYRAGLARGDGVAYLRNFVLNWLNTVIAQSFSDRFELMRGETLFTGQLTLRGGTVDFGVPARNRFARRTGSQAYGGPDSLLWRDMRAADNILGSTRTRIMSMNTLNELLDSARNPLSVTSENITAGGNIKIVGVRRLIGSQQTLSLDAREAFTLVGYSRRVALKVGQGYAYQQVVPDGKIAVIGSNSVTIDQTDGTTVTRPGLGRLHVGPTVENEGRPGVWLNAYTPQDRPYHAIAQGAANALTILDAPEKLVILDTEMSA